MAKFSNQTKYSLWATSYFKNNGKLFLYGMGIIGNFQIIIGWLPMNYQEIIYNSLNWVTDMPWYWQIIIGITGFSFIAMNNGNKTYVKDMTQKDEEIAQRDEEISKLNIELNNRKKKNTLSLELQAIIERINKDQLLALPTINYSELLKEIVTLLRESTIISEGEIITFEHDHRWSHTDKIIPLIMDIVRKLTYYK